MKPAGLPILHLIFAEVPVTPEFLAALDQIKATLFGGSLVATRQASSKVGGYCD
jgi:hypothetical protein